MYFLQKCFVKGILVGSLKEQCPLCPPPPYSAAN